MKKKLLLPLLLLLLIAQLLPAQIAQVQSPDKKLKVEIYLDKGKPYYTVIYDDKTLLKKSPLGLLTNEGDFSSEMTFVAQKKDKKDKEYTQDKIKKSQIHYIANALTCTFENAQKHMLDITFQVSNNDIAFRYELPIWGDRRACVIQAEATGYNLPSEATSFISPMMGPMGAFARTSPSYESGYSNDEPINNSSWSDEGYVFPALFRIGDDAWILLSETGVRSLYCASHLSKPSSEGIYTIEYPNIKQNNGFGSTGAQVALPGTTPWRTITVGDNLKPIVETTIPYDVVEPLYEASQIYQYGRSTWSWIVWMDESMNWDDQVEYIDLAAELGYEYILIDALWDENIGYERMKDLVEYAHSKGVDVFLWYNSNGGFNDAPQGPHNKMNTSIARKKEMKWLQKLGVKGLKVDFLGGDKQETMRLYEDKIGRAHV